MEDLGQGNNGNNKHLGSSRCGKDLSNHHLVTQLEICRPHLSGPGKSNIFMTDQ